MIPNSPFARSRFRTWERLARCGSPGPGRGWGEGWCREILFKRSINIAGGWIPPLQWKSWFVPVFLSLLFKVTLMAGNWVWKFSQVEEGRKRPDLQWHGALQGPVRGKFRQATRPWNSDMGATKLRQATTRETYKRWTDSEFCIFTRFNSETHSAREETFPSVVLLFA